VNRKLRTGEKIGLWLSRVAIWVALVFALFPALWVVTASFQPGMAFYSSSLIPHKFTLANYIYVFTQTDFWLWVKNSLIVAGVTALVQMLVTASSAYAFSRMRFPGRKFGLMGLLLLQMLPSTMALAAIYTLLVRLHLLGSLLGLILVFCGASAYNIWLFKGYIDSLPRELDEAAYADGATHWQIFTRIILPLARPMLAVQFIWSFTGIYNEYMLSSLVLQSPKTYTVAVGLQRFIANQYSAHWTYFAAGATVASVPILIVYMTLQRHLESGLTRGAVKG